MRFPEFSGEWETKSINDLADVIGGGTPDTTVKSYWDGGIQWFTPSEIGKNKFVDASLRTITEDGLNNSSAKLLPPNTILLSSRATIGECSLSLRECATNQGFQSLVSKKCNVDFLYYLIQTKKKDLIRKSCGSTFLEISANEVRKIQVSVPSDVEQQKIAGLLSLIDKRIATQNKIIEDLKKLKSAIVDKLYSSAKGETYSFRQLFEVVNEKNKKLIYSNVLSASQELGMIERSDINIDIKFEQNSISEYKIVRKGDYVVHLRSFQGGFAFSDRTGICSPAYTILHPNDLVAYGYLSHFFISKPFIKSLKLVTYGIRDGRSINVDEWLDMTVTLPTKREQSHILAIINAIDNKLHNENQIHNYMFRQRTYLLKTMFI
ncbi:restriction endonuclease subunit S [Alistipes finegoldii]|uniref:restriction endonuclease subunit S n=1 Tax=Alistipes finegoldii TaxID=214856 RepID=UPI001C37F78B|nr:restriction endonuclease subunit S [Alistipes finegoldii]MBV4348324.1 restriction endonuclease subunit S [Alistipes finegoldii]